MSDDQDVTELDERERRLFASLPRESVPSPHELDHLVSALRAEGFFRARERRFSRVTRCRPARSRFLLATARARPSNGWA